MEAGNCATQAAQTRLLHLRITAVVGGLGGIGNQGGQFGQGAVAFGPVSSGQSCTVGPMVPHSGNSYLWSPNMTRYNIKKTAVCSPSTYGGVGGRGREASPSRSVYSRLASTTTRVETFRSTPSLEREGFSARRFETYLDAFRDCRSRPLRRPILPISPMRLCEGLTHGNSVRFQPPCFCGQRSARQRAGPT